MASHAPDGLLYAKSHEWLRLRDGAGTVGISDHAQQELTDVVYVELPAIGAEVQAGDQICVVESVKAASDIYAPATGTVSEVNEALKANPALLNTDPYGEGWIFKLSLPPGEGSGGLLTAEEYRAQTGGEA